MSLFLFTGTHQACLIFPIVTYNVFCIVLCINDSGHQSGKLTVLNYPFSLSSLPSADISLSSLPSASCLLTLPKILHHYAVFYNFSKNFFILTLILNLRIDLFLFHSSPKKAKRNLGLKKNLDQRLVSQDP